MKYCELIKKSMEFMAQDDKSIFLGYNVKFGGKGAGALINIPEYKLIEMPVAENLMASTAIGLSLEGFVPIVYFERFDFVLNAVDAIVNHLDKIKNISNAEFNPKVIIRVVVGRKNFPLFSGETHTQDFTEVFQKLLKFPVIKLPKTEKIFSIYENAYFSNLSHMIIEEADNYNIEC